jgi:acetylornithine deacetylase
MLELKKKVEEYVAQINADLGSLPTRGPCSKYEIPGQTGTVELTWGPEFMEGIACSLESEGYTALCDATKEVVGKCTPYSICGSLPLVRDLQRGGFDVQLTGYGLSSTYHADNEYCELPMMASGFKVLLRVLTILEEK